MGSSTGHTIAEAALIEFFKKMRPGDPATLTMPVNSLRSSSSTSGITTWSGWVVTS